MAEPKSPRRAAWLEIDLDALEHNLGVIRELVGPSVTVAPVVKADAYGHGVEVVGPLLAASAEVLCVATLDEALALRALGVTGRIILLYPVPPSGIDEALAARVELTLMSASEAGALLPRLTVRGQRRARVHIAVDTGMARGGLATDGVVALARVLERDGRVELAGLWTHLASAGDPGTSAAQVARFGRAAEALRAADLAVPPRHVAASEGIFAGTGPGFELVRPGLAVYGVLDETLALTAAAKAAANRLRPAMTLKARAAAFSEVATGDGVGYGALWRATRPSRVALLPLGYGDGYSRASWPDAVVLLRGRRRPVVGAISMDAIMVDVTDTPDASALDEFVLMGSQGGESIAATDLARWRNTIAWEVLSGMARRLDRVYNRSAGATQGNAVETGATHDPSDQPMG